MWLALLDRLTSRLLLLLLLVMLSPRAVDGLAGLLRGELPAVVLLPLAKLLFLGKPSRTVPVDV